MSAEAKQGYYELIEPRTLFNSIIPVLLGMMYTEYNFQFFRIFPTIEMCIATIVLQIFMNVKKLPKLAIIRRIPLVSITLILNTF